MPPFLIPVCYADAGLGEGSVRVSGRHSGGPGRVHGAATVGRRGSPVDSKLIPAKFAPDDRSSRILFLFGPA